MVGNSVLFQYSETTETSKLTIKGYSQLIVELYQLYLSKQSSYYKLEDRVLKIFDHTEQPRHLEQSCFALQLLAMVKIINQPHMNACTVSSPDSKLKTWLICKYWRKQAPLSSKTISTSNGFSQLNNIQSRASQTQINRSLFEC